MNGTPTPTRPTLSTSSPLLDRPPAVRAAHRDLSRICSHDPCLPSRRRCSPARVCRSARSSRSGKGPGGFRQNAGRRPTRPFSGWTPRCSSSASAACAPVFNQAGAFLFEDAAAQFVSSRWARHQSLADRRDDRGEHPVAGRAAAAAQTPADDAGIAPAGTCSGIYNQVIYWPEPCPAIKARVSRATPATARCWRASARARRTPGCSCT